MAENTRRAKLTSRFEEALVYAARLHAGQTRKASGTPYVAHLLSVAALVMEDGGDEDEAIAALLHDAIEDQGGDTARQEIRRRFGETIMAIVDGCSDAETVPKPPWRERKEAFLSSLRHVSPQVRRVVAADKLHNVRSLRREVQRQGEAIWQHFRGGKEGTLWYHREVTRILEEKGTGWLVTELREAVANLEDLARHA